MFVCMSPWAPLSAVVRSPVGKQQQGRGRDTWMDRSRWEVDVATPPHPDPQTLRHSGKEPHLKT